MKSIFISTCTLYFRLFIYSVFYKNQIKFPVVSDIKYLKIQQIIEAIRNYMPINHYICMREVTGFSIHIYKT